MSCRGYGVVGQVSLAEALKDCTIRSFPPQGMMARRSISPCHTQQCKPTGYSRVREVMPVPAISPLHGPEHVSRA